MSRLPWMKFHKTDWLREPSLKLCSRAARSLWLDMLCLMHDAQPCGHLALHGKALDARALAVLLGDRPRTLERLLGELEAARVFDRLADGTIVCRRMVADARKAQSGQQSAQRRWQRQAEPNGSDGEGLAALPSPQNQNARPQSPDQDQTETPEPDLPELHENGLGGFAGTGASASGSPAEIATPRLKRPERADQHLAEHMIGQGMDAGQVWTLIGAARDPAHAQHEASARQCEDYSRRFRLGWFAGERSWPPLNVVGGGRRR